MDIKTFAPNMNIKDKTDIGLVSDHRGLDKLRALGNSSNIHDKAMALKAAAEQFENLLNQYWVNAMRESNQMLDENSPLHSKYSSFFEDMLSNQQVSLMTQNSQGINKNSITYLITEQFSKSLGDEGKAILEHLNSLALNNNRPLDVVKSPKNISTNTFSSLIGTNNTTDQSSLPSIEQMKDIKNPEDFVDKMMKFAQKAVEGKNMNPLVLVAQAALETGWGQHVPDNNNYYGIKASDSWTGKSLDLISDEFEDGQFTPKLSSFRAYDSPLESMQDYIHLIKNSQRYQKAAQKSFDPDAYFDEIQKAGYATDPNYATKLKDIARKIVFMACN